jgi:hypothetical protein
LPLGVRVGQEVLDALFFFWCGPGEALTHEYLSFHLSTNSRSVHLSQFKHTRAPSTASINPAGQVASSSALVDAARPPESVYSTRTLRSVHEAGSIVGGFLFGRARSSFTCGFVVKLTPGSLALRIVASLVKLRSFPRCPPSRGRRPRDLCECTALQMRALGLTPLSLFRYAAPRPSHHFVSIKQIFGHYALFWRVFH